MTRDETNDAIYELTYQREITEQEVYSLAHKMIDDFESRNCENCKYAKIEGEYLRCTNMMAMGWWCDEGVTNNETCSKFEPKDEV